jgi:hypothetical protein
MKNSSSTCLRIAMTLAAILLAALTGQAQAPTNPPALGSIDAGLMQSFAAADSDKVIGSIAWKIIEETTGRMLDHGDGPVRLRDVIVSAGTAGNGNRFARKRIQLNSQFALEMAEFPIPNMADKKGFGIAAQCAETSCFSWEWFIVQDSKHAFKSKEGGALDIDLKQVGSDWEITQTRFKTDISLRIFRIGVDAAGSKPSWRINIAKGSNITWPSTVNGKVVPN